MNVLRALWGAVGRLLVRPAVPAMAAALTLVLFVAQSEFLQKHMKLKVEASDLLPKDHPKNAEFDFIRATFKGSSRGFFVAVEAPVLRLRQVVPQVADAFAGLPDIEFIRYRIEREYFEQNLLLFQSLADLDRHVGYM